MDRSSRTGTLRVVVENEADQEEDLSERVDPDMVVGDVRRRWGEAFGLDPERLQLLTPNLNPLTDATLLSGLREESRLLRLLVRVAVDVEVALCGSAAPAQGARVFLTSTPSAVLPEFRPLFAVPLARPLRLCTASGEVLDPDAPLQDQGVVSGSRLLLDPAFRVSVTEVWDEREKTVTCFGTETVIPVLVDGPDLVELVREDGGKVPLSARVGKAFEVEEGLPEEEHCLTAVRTRRIAVQNGRRLKERVLLPKDSPQLLPESLVTEDGRPVSVRLSCGRRKLVRVPGPALVADLHRELARLEDGDFVLTSRGQQLDPLAWLDSVGGEEVAVQRREPLSVTILLPDGGEVTYVPGGGRTLVLLSDLQHEVDETKTFFCDGCQRRIFSEEQKIPVDCCPCRSLRLRCDARSEQDMQDAAIQDAETQTEPRTAEAGLQFNSTFLRKEVTIDIFPDQRSKRRKVVHLEPHHDLNTILQLTADELNICRTSLSYAYQGGGQFIADDQNFCQIAYEQADGDRYVQACGQTFKNSCRITNIQKPLQTLSDITFTPGGKALVRIDMDSDFVSFDVDGTETRLGHECVHDPKYAAWIEGHRLMFGREGGQALLLDSNTESNSKSLFSTNTVDVKTGRVFRNCDDAYSRHFVVPPEGKSANFVYVMLMAGTRLPKWKVPKGHLLIVVVRRGVRLSLDHNGCVRVDSTGRLRPEWVFEPTNDAFRKALTNYMNF